MMKQLQQFTRQIIDARRTMGLTQEDAAPLLGVNCRTLQKYECEDVGLHPDVVQSMSQVYHDPRLRTIYCEQVCEIGRHEKPCGCEKSTETLMLGLLMTDTAKLPEVVRTLHRIMQDGVIDETEQADCDECLQFLTDLEAGVKGLRLQVQTMCRASERRQK